MNTHVFSSCFDVVSRSHVVGAVRNGCSGLHLFWLGHWIDCGVKKTCEGYERCTAVLLSKTLVACTHRRSRRCGRAFSGEERSDFNLELGMLKKEDEPRIFCGHFCWSCLKAYLVSSGNQLVWNSDTAGKDWDTGGQEQLDYVFVPTCSKFEVQTHSGRGWMQRIFSSEKKRS